MSRRGAEAQRRAAEKIGNEIAREKPLRFTEAKLRVSSGTLLVPHWVHDEKVTEEKRTMFGAFFWVAYLYHNGYKQACLLHSNLSALNETPFLNG